MLSARVRNEFAIWGSEEYFVTEILTMNTLNVLEQTEINQDTNLVRGKTKICIKLKGGKKRKKKKKKTKQLALYLFVVYPSNKGYSLLIESGRGNRKGNLGNFVTLRQKICPGSNGLFSSFFNPLAISFQGSNILGHGSMWVIGGSPLSRYFFVMSMLFFLQRHEVSFSQWKFLQL